MFDPSTFLNTEYNEQSSTIYTPVPEGEYNAVTTGEVKVRQGTDDKGDTYTVVDISWEIDDADGKIKEATNRDKNVVRQSLFLELTPQGHLDFGKGKNVQLGKLREALGQNDEGKPWNFNMLIGRAAKIQIKHRADKAGAPIANVVAVTKIAA